MIHPYSNIILLFCIGGTAKFFIFPGGAPGHPLPHSVKRGSRQCAPRLSQRRVTRAGKGTVHWHRHCYGAAGGTGFTALLTALGAATVFFFRSRPDPTVHRIFLGFAAGVMIAASMWSLLIPAIEEAEAMGMVGWVPAAGGSVLGIAFLLAMDALLPQLTPESFRHLGRRTPLLVLAVTLHNIPEGMAVGISFALASQGDNPRPAHRRRRSGPGYRHPELPRGGCHRPASAPGRAQPGQILLDGGPVRRRGAHFALLTVLWWAASSR